VLLAAATVGLAAAGIYPDDHWSYATKLSTDDEFNSLVETSIDQGKTLFVRWIASEG
jgi:hypothetical protein